MTLVVVFGACLMLSVLVSSTAVRTVLSPALIFLVAGAITARLGWVTLRADDPLLERLVDVALFTVVFVEASALRGGMAGRSRFLLGRGVVLGLAVAIGGVAVLAHLLAGFGWLHALLIGAVLAPIGPMIASSAWALGDPSPRRLRSWRTDSALRTGLTLPLVVLLISAAADGGFGDAALRLAGGLALGVALPAVMCLLAQVPALGSVIRRQPMSTLALGVLLYGLATVGGVDPYLAAFVGGAMLGWLDPQARVAFASLGDQLTTLASSATVLIFGALLVPLLFRSVPALAWLAIVGCALLVRPAATAVSVWTGGSLSTSGSGSTRGSVSTSGSAPAGRPGRAALAAGWLTPAPFICVMLALLVLRSGAPGGAGIYTFVAVSIAVGVVVHAATDIVVARSGGAEPGEQSAGSATWTSSATPFSTR